MVTLPHLWAACSMLKCMGSSVFASFGRWIGLTLGLMGAKMSRHGESFIGAIFSLLFTLTSGSLWCWRIDHSERAGLQASEWRPHRESSNFWPDSGWCILGKGSSFSVFLFAQIRAVGKRINGWPKKGPGSLDYVCLSTVACGVVVTVQISTSSIVTGLLWPWTSSCRLQCTGLSTDSTTVGLL